MFDKRTIVTSTLTRIVDVNIEEETTASACQIKKEKKILARNRTIKKV